MLLKDLSNHFNFKEKIYEKNPFTLSLSLSFLL
ncbi:babC, partial [Helicobacter pylori]